MAGEDAQQPSVDLEDLMKRLAAAQDGLLATLREADPETFEVEGADGASIKRSIERTVDDLNFYYGALVAKALNLPQPPCLSTADFSSLREATMALQVSQRRFTNLLHDLIPEDLDKTTTDDKHVTYTLRQLIEMTAAHYNLRVKQLGAIASSASTPG